MRRFAIKTAPRHQRVYPYALFICHGDDRGFCETCRAKFLCYTGELPSEAMIENYRIDEGVEEYLFGSRNLYLIEYDFERHSKEYKTNIDSTQRNGSVVRIKYNAYCCTCQKCTFDKCLVREEDPA